MRAVVTWVVANMLAAVLLVPAVAVATDPAARLIADIDPSGGSRPQLLTTVGARTFFSATDGFHGRELWTTDGTTAGTRMVRDIRPGSGGSAPHSLTKVGKLLYFSADDGSHGRELWASDGTRKGTRLVRDLVPGAKGSGELQITGVGERAYFSRSYEDLWRTDGTAASTRLVRTFKGIDLVGSAVMGSRLYFSADGALWKTDASGTSTKRISPRSLYGGPLTPFRGRLYFSGMLYGRQDSGCGEGETGCIEPPRLWWSDGTWAGTKPVGHILASEEFEILGDAIYFNGWTDTIRPRLYASDGTKAGTARVAPRVRPLPGMQKQVGLLWMTRSSGSMPWRDELWVSDGTADGTALVNGGTADWFTADDTLECVGLDGRLWFAAGPGQSEPDGRLLDHELWVSDGTTAGTFEAVDINPTGSSFPRDFAKLAGSLILSASDGEHGRELWMVTP
jgi:ELWxxDGT repeat protein